MVRINADGDDDTCIIHPQQPLKYFCYPCGDQLCMHCAAQDHPQGKWHHVEHISDVAEAQRILLHLTEQAGVALKDWKSRESQVDGETRRLQEEVNRTHMAIVQRYHNCIGVLDNATEKMKANVSYRQLLRQQQLSEEKRNLMVKQSCVSNAEAYLRKALALNLNNHDQIRLHSFLERSMRSHLKYSPLTELIQGPLVQFKVPEIDSFQTMLMNTFGYIRDFTEQPARPAAPQAPVSSTYQGMWNGQSGGMWAPPAGEFPQWSSASASFSSGRYSSGSDAESSTTLRGSQLPSYGNQGQGRAVFFRNDMGFNTAEQTNGHFPDVQDGGIAGLDYAGMFNSLPTALHEAMDGTMTTVECQNGAFGPTQLNQSKGMVERLISVGDPTGIWSNTTPAGSRKNSFEGFGGWSSESFSSRLQPRQRTCSKSSSQNSSLLQPPKCQQKRGKMGYIHKFGEFGVEQTKFTEPSGVAVSPVDQSIVVADTNSHRIQVFTEQGLYCHHFGECGKRDGQMLYPNRVAVFPRSGNIAVTERCPTHQIQIYSPSGKFLRKFGSSLLENPRGLTIDHKDRIVVVECKVMRVTVFDAMGKVIHRFTAADHLNFPNGCATNEKEEIFISDNRSHCVKVFTYSGQYLRQIGKPALTNYPIGVGITPQGLVLVADNHNNFNVTLFTQEGVLVEALESRVKHAQCFDIALMGQGQIVLASRDFRIYVYQYDPPEQSAAFKF